MRERETHFGTFMSHTDRGTSGLFGTQQWALLDNALLYDVVMAAERR